MKGDGKSGTGFVGGGMKRRRKWPWIVVLSAVVIFAVAWAVPKSRNAIANTLGFRAEVTIVASEGNVGSDIDGNPLVNLKNFSANINGNELSSNGDTAIVASGVEFGNSTVTVNKDGYQSASLTRTIDADVFFGLLGKPINDNFTALLTPDSESLTLKVKDWVSGQPLSKGQFITGDRIARPNQDGEVTLLRPQEGDELAVEVQFETDYLDRNLTLDLNKQDHSVNVVPSGFVYTVDKKNYDIYQSYVDGSAKEKFISATDQESSNLQFAISPNGNFALMASTRDGKRDADGDLLTKLYIVNMTNAELDEIDEGYDFELYDWSRNTVVYSYKYKPAGSDDKKQRLRSVDAGSSNHFELGDVNGTLTQVHVVDSTVVYAAKQPDGLNTVTSVGLQGTSERRLGTDVNDLRQVQFTTFAYKTNKQTWNFLNVTTNQISAAAEPSGSKQLFFATPTPQQQRLLVSFKDDAKVLAYVSSDNKTTPIASGDNLSGPVRFINATSLIYRVNDELFVASTLGGEPKKVGSTNDTSRQQTPFFAFY